MGFRKIYHNKNSSWQLLLPCLPFYLCLLMENNVSKNLSTMLPMDGIVPNVRLICLIMTKGICLNSCFKTTLNLPSLSSCLRMYPLNSPILLQRIYTCFLPILPQSKKYFLRLNAHNCCSHFSLKWKLFKTSLNWRSPSYTLGI